MFVKQVLGLGEAGPSAASCPRPSGPGPICPSRQGAGLQVASAKDGRAGPGGQMVPPALWRPCTREAIWGKSSPAGDPPPTSCSARPMAAVTAPTVYQAHAGDRDSVVLLGPSCTLGGSSLLADGSARNPGRTGLGDQQGGPGGQPALFSGTEGPSQKEGLRNEFARPAGREGCPRGPEERVERGWGGAGLSACPPTLVRSDLPRGSSQVRTPGHPAQSTRAFLPHCQGLLKAAGAQIQTPSRTRAYAVGEKPLAHIQETRGAHCRYWPVTPQPQ